MTFYQDNKRNESQSFSNDTFKLILSETIIGCVPDFDKFLRKFIKSELLLNCGDNISPMYEGTNPDDGIIDYMIAVPLASHILYALFLETSETHFKNQIDLRIQQLNDAIGPRTGEHVIKAY